MTTCEQIATSTSGFLIDKLYNNENGYTLKEVIKEGSNWRVKTARAVAGALLPILAVCEAIIRTVAHVFLAIGAFFLGCAAGVIGLVARLVGKREFGDNALTVAEKSLKFIHRPLYIGLRDTYGAMGRSIKAITKCKG